MRGVSGRIKQPALSAFLIMMLLLAVVPAQAGNAPGIANSSVSTYIVVFDDTSHDKEKAARIASDLAVTCGGHVKYRYKVIDGMAVELSDEAAEKLRKQPGVKYVEKDHEVHVLLDRAVVQIGADQVRASGYTGKGVKVCVIDTGVDVNHPDLNGSKVIAWIDYVRGNVTPYDDNGHGTHVSSTIAGTGAASNGQYRGVAPEASLMEAKVLNSRGTGSVSNIVAAIDWATENGAQVISMSLGSTVHDQSLDDAVTSAVERGVAVVVAAGNEGPYSGSISCPGDCEDAITVGAVDRNDTIAEFSSRGPTYDGRVKPDVTGMGVGLVAAKAGGTSASGYYRAMSGTSMATPMVAGVAALMLQKKSSMTPAEVKFLLERTAKPLGEITPNNVYGWGRVQANYAVDNVTTNVPAYDSSYVSDTFPGTMQAGQASTVNITLENTGGYGWSLANNTCLKGSMDASGFGATSFGLPSGIVVRPGEEYTWSMTLTAPSATGSYVLNYQMSNDTGTFGYALNKTVAVKATLEPGTIQFHNTTYTVARSAGKATIRVDRVGGLDNTVSVNYSTAGMTRTGPGYNGSASDYVPANGTLTFAQGQDSAAFNVTIQADSYYKGNMTIDLELSDAAGGASLGDNMAQLAVVDDAPRPAFKFSLSQYSASKNQTNATIVVYCTNNYYLNASVDYTVGGGNATPGVDYVPAGGTLNFAARQFSRSFNVTILDNDPYGPDKNLNLTLSSPTNGSVLGTPSTSVLTISDSLINFTYHLNKGWNMISVPLLLQNDSVDAFFPAGVKANMTDMWHYSNGTWIYYSGTRGYSQKYAHLTNVTPGQGYWVKLSNNSTFTISGLNNISGVSSASSGWTMFGVQGLGALNATTAYTNNKDMWYYSNGTWYYYSATRGYSPKYAHLDTLDPGKGYWVHL